MYKHYLDEDYCVKSGKNIYFPNRIMYGKGESKGLVLKKSSVSLKRIYNDIIKVDNRINHLMSKFNEIKKYDFVNVGEYKVHGRGFGRGVFSKKVEQLFIVQNTSDVLWVCPASQIFNEYKRSRSLEDFFIKVCGHEKNEAKQGAEKILNEEIKEITSLIASNDSINDAIIYYNNAFKYRTYINRLVSAYTDIFIKEKGIYNIKREQVYRDNFVIHFKEINKAIIVPGDYCKLPEFVQMY